MLFFFGGHLVFWAQLRYNACMSHESHFSDYSRYFSQRQKVYLVNMSATRNNEIYESLSGVVTSSGMNSLELMVACGGAATTADEVGTAIYKLTSEAFGSGIQVLAVQTGVIGDTIFQFRMQGTLEMFQRRIVPRVELSTNISQIYGNFPLASFKKEWQRVREHMRTAGALPRVVLQKTAINLSVGGIGLTVDLQNRPTPYSMFFVALDQGLPLCVLAETVWEQREEEKLRCGFRFIYILKSDQERISTVVGDLIRESGGTPMDYKRNWVLVDKMVADIRKS